MDNNYWEVYRNYWNDFVRSWFNNQAKPWDPITTSFSNTGKLNFDELPEPYLGDPQNGVQAVIININPGGSQRNDFVDLEATKFYSKRKGSGAWLLDALENDFSMSYSEYLKKYSCLNPELTASIGLENEVCGVEWWQQSAKSPLPWLNRIYHPKDGNIQPLKVFALEFCPFHSASQRFSLREFVQKGVPKDWFKEYVVKPACLAAKESKLPCVVGVGKIIADALDVLGYECTKFDADSGFSAWPTRENGKKVNRTYRVYVVEDVRMLITSAPGGNSCPSEQFQSVEEEILRRTE